ncbi:MAG: hypothetical protein QOF47_1271 [Mycobacterium sp.]|nr:hypothetical protein [Mycobacterium sp.]
MYRVAGVRVVDGNGRFRHRRAHDRRPYSRAGLRLQSRFVRVASPPAGLRQLAEYEAEHETRGQTWIEVDEKPWETVLWAGWKQPVETRDILLVRDPLWNQAAEDVNLTDEETIHRWRGSCMWGQHEAAHFCYYSSMALLGVDLSAWRPHLDIGTECGWWWGLDDLVVMVDRPVAIGATIGFRDDWAAILTQ